MGLGCYGDVFSALPVVEREDGLPTQFGPLEVDFAEFAVDVFVVEALAGEEFETVVEDPEI